jgi:RHS repeat-associated protein
VLADGTVIDFDYDWLWRRRAKVTNGATRQWIWAGDVPLVELGHDGERVDYMFHPDESLPIGLKIDGVWHYIVTDYRGEPLDVVRVEDGAIVWSAEPRGFDSLISLDQLSGRFRLRAPGQYVDTETSLVYNRARYYDPTEGRFVTPDPLGPATGANLYHYCFNQPLDYVDETGLAPCATQAECDAIFADVKGTVESKKPPAAMKGLEQRWKETADASKPADILAWERPPSGINPPKGTVKGHITAYKSTQNRLNNQLAKYDKGGCQAYEDSSRKESMDYYRAWQGEKMKLGPGYGTPPPHIAALI